MLQSKWAPDGTKPARTPIGRSTSPVTTDTKNTTESTASADSKAPPTTETQATTASTQANTTPSNTTHNALTITTSYDPAYDDPSVDPFAQTASTDDIFFNDDITPIVEPVVEQSFVAEEAAPPFAPEDAQPRAGLETETIEASTNPSIPTEPKEKTQHSVRGDRTLTGGAARTRLTEEQLNAKLANMRSKNEALETAHARAEADQAKFEAREAVLIQQDVERKQVQAERQKAERHNRAQMMDEREKNRLRKLNAQSGREWDFDKEEGFSGTGEERRRGAGRGAHGGMAPWGPAETTSTFEQFDVTDSSQSYRGGVGGWGGHTNRGGRGGHHDTRLPADEEKDAQHPTSAADFPDLSSSGTPVAKEDTSTPGAPNSLIETQTTDLEGSETPEKPGIEKQASFGLPSPLEKGRSWADEVDSKMVDVGVQIQRL